MNEELNIQNDAEIQKSLKEFEEKANMGQTSKPLKTPQDSELPTMVRMVMKISGGSITKQKTAEYVLLGLVVLMIAISLLLFFGGGNSSSYKEKVIPPMPPAGIDDPNFNP